MRQRAVANFIVEGCQQPSLLQQGRPQVHQHLPDLADSMAHQDPHLRLQSDDFRCWRETLIRLKGQHRFMRHADRRHGLAEMVMQRLCQAPDQGSLLRHEPLRQLGKLLARALQLGVPADTLGDVAQACNQQQFVALRDLGYGRFQLDRLPVGPHCLDAPARAKASTGRLRGGKFAQVQRMRRARSLGQQQLHALTQHGLAGVAKNALGPGIEHSDAPIDIGGDDGIVGRVDHAGEHLTLLPQRTLDPVLLADIPEINGQSFPGGVGGDRKPGVQAIRIRGLKARRARLGQRSLILDLVDATDRGRVFFPNVAAEQFLAAALQHLLGVCVDISETPVPIEREEGVGHVFDHVGDAS